MKVVSDEDLICSYSSERSVSSLIGAFVLFYNVGKIS